MEGELQVQAVDAAPVAPEAVLPELDATQDVIAARFAESDYAAAGKVSGSGDGPMEAAIRKANGKGGPKSTVR